MKKYKLIKEYPGSIKLGETVVKECNYYIFEKPAHSFLYRMSFATVNVENYPEYWQEVKEQPKYMRRVNESRSNSMYGEVGVIYKVDNWLDNKRFYTTSLFCKDQHVDFFEPATEEEYNKQQQANITITYGEICEQYDLWLDGKGRYAKANSFTSELLKYMIEKYENNNSRK